MTWKNGVPALAAAVLGIGAAVAAGPAASVASARGEAAPPTKTRFAELERSTAARIGVFTVDTATGDTVSYRASERFAYASTGKIFSAGLALWNLTDRELDAVVRWSQADVLAYAPITDDFVESGLAVRHLLNAELVWSDNTAANVVVNRLGGPASIQRGLRSIGDRVTHVDRLEPELNTAVPGDPRDTTTPRQLARNLQTLVLGHVLTPTRRRLLKTLMETNTTGDALIRAAVPSGWRVADKTGSAEYGTRNDVAVVEPPGHAPVVIAVTTTHAEATSKTDDAAVAAAARLALQALRVT